MFVFDDAFEFVAEKERHGVEFTSLFALLGRLVKERLDFSFPFVLIVQFQVDEEVFVLHVEELKALLLRHLLLVNVRVALVTNYTADHLYGCDRSSSDQI